MEIDGTLLDWSYTDDVLTMIVQINMRERRAITFTPETYAQWKAEQARIEAAWERARDKRAVDYYTLLGVARNSSADEIQHAYRALAKRYHPDTSASDTTAAMQQLNLAFAALSDPQQRQKYDRTLSFT